MALHVALCASTALPLASEPPTRIVVLPAGEEVRGRDGRAWTVKDRAAILAQLARRPVLLDVNHASVHAAPRGGESHAAGWLTDFQFGPEGLSAAVEWTPYGAELFSKKAYRYLSPALLHDSKSGTPTGILGSVQGLHSVGLTNDPNLDLPALNSPEISPDMTPEQLKKLGLKADATQEQIDARIAELAAPKSGLPDSLVGEIKDLFAGLVASLKPALPVAANSNATEAHSIAVNAVVDAAVAAGKIAPASKAAFVAMGGTTTETLKALQTTIDTLPVLVATNAREHKAPAKDGSKLTPAQEKICAQLGVSAEEFLKSRSELK